MADDDHDSGHRRPRRARCAFGRRCFAGRSGALGRGSAFGRGSAPGEAVPSGDAGAIRWQDGTLSGPGYKDAVAAAVRRISRGDLRKVVLARDVHATAERPFDTRAVLARLSARYPECYTFACGGLVGADARTADPARRRPGPVAGPGRDDATGRRPMRTDARLAAELLASARSRGAPVRGRLGPRRAGPAVRVARRLPAGTAHAAERPPSRDARGRRAGHGPLGARPRGGAASHRGRRRRPHGRRGGAYPGAGVHRPGALRRPGRVAGRQRER